LVRNRVLISGEVHPKRKELTMKIPVNPIFAGRPSQAAGVVLSAVMSVSLAFAQAQPAQSNGEEAFTLLVVDQQGAVIVGAHVSLTAMAGGKPKNGTTNRQGIWSESLLTGGLHNFSVEARGFATYSARVMIVEGRPAMRRVIMMLNVVRQEEEVEGTAFLVETSAPSPPAQLETVPYRDSDGLAGPFGG